jgi:hypothetical protein
MNGPVVVISGAPAAGKTTLGRPLARHLGWPLISKDVIKESLYDELGNPRSRRRSKRMGQAAFEILYALLDDMPTAVIETHWHPDISGPRLRGLDRPVVEICCQCDRQVRLARLGSRPRHPGHLESRLKLMPSWIKQRMPLGFEEPLDLGGPLLRLETTEPIDIAVVARWVEANVANEAAVR